jgi:hypothetical protein
VTCTIQARAVPDVYLTWNHGCYERPSKIPQK